MKSIRPGVYRHYKGNEYLVLGEAIHSETPETMVLYTRLYASFRLEVRPKRMFLERVVKPEYHYRGPRFKLIGRAGGYTTPRARRASRRR
ncbi:DUF1653 domain-containing protein [Candidatus Parcubacteria bacterium]|nr:MAG: DUF1653 domain-containing protein [Candidatus Parcubacteria bacterium]